MTLFRKKQVIRIKIIVHGHDIISRVTLGLSASYNIIPKKSKLNDTSFSCIFFLSCDASSSKITAVCI